MYCLSLNLLFFFFFYLEITHTSMLSRKFTCPLTLVLKKTCYSYRSYRSQSEPEFALNFQKTLSNYSFSCKALQSLIQPLIRHLNLRFLSAAGVERRAPQRDRESQQSFIKVTRVRGGLRDLSHNPTILLLRLYRLVSRRVPFKYLLLKSNGALKKKFYLDISRYCFMV